MALRKLINEIHRRSLWQVLGIYVVGAWIAYEVIQSLTEGMGLPGWFPSLAVVLFIIGLPIVLATAFVQEGVRREPRAQPASAEEAVGAERAAPSRAEAGGARRLFTWRNAITGGVLAFALWGVIATGWLLFGNSSGGDAADGEVVLDPNVVAVLPFRVAGADPSVEYLREGMVDLLAAKLTGEGGLRSVDPRAVISAWRRVAGPSGSDLTEEATLQVARSLGAGRLLLGGLVGTSDHIVLNASLLSVPDGEISAQASVEGSTDNLTGLVDRLTAQLLAREAGEAQQRLAALTSTSLPALRAYLDGQAAFRRGGFAESEERFEQALELDSTFALAAIGLVSARFWTANLIDNRGLRLAWEQRERLSQRDRAVLIALAGPRYPEQSPFSEILAASERAVEAAPGRAEAWNWLGEMYYHQGPAMGVSETRQRANDAFSRAVELDSAFSAPLSHVIDLAILGGDTAAVRRLIPLYLALDTVGDFRDYMGWQAAIALGDSVAVDSLRARFPELSTLSLRAVVRQSVLRGNANEDIELAAAVLRERSGTRGERFGTLNLLHDLALNRGRPGEALAITDALEQVQPTPRFVLWLRVTDALYGDGDASAAARAADRIAPHADAALTEIAEKRTLQYADICTVEQWRLWHGEYDTAARGIARLRGASFPRDSSPTVLFTSSCAAILEGMLAVLQERPDADEAIIRLDSVMRTLPTSARYGNLVVARLHESRGNLEAAQRAAQRRIYFNTRYLASYLREEGRLAVLIGDQDSAIRAYRHYLALRTDPEPELAGEVENVRAELARLTSEAGS
jgi:tetratricopeptide (TPR) repeat protein